MGSSLDEEKKRIKERYGRVPNDSSEPSSMEPEEISTVSKKFLEFETENELDERSRSFRLQSYNAPEDEGKGKAKCSTLLHGAKRLLIIVLIIGLICGTVFLVSKFLARNRLLAFTLEGNETHFPLFQGLDSSVPCEDLGSLVLRNVELSPPAALLQALEGCHRLKTIVLENVRVRGEFNGSVRLPALSEFTYSESLGGKSVQEVMSSMTESRLKSILFFRDSGKSKRKSSSSSSGAVRTVGGSPQDSVDLSKVWDMDVNVNVSSEGHTILVVNHTRGELILPWLSYLKREEIIQNAGKDLRKLACNRHKLTVDSLPPKLTHLTLRDVKLLGGDFNTILRKLTKLVDIRVSFADSTPLDLGDLPRRSLRNLALSKAALSNSKPGRKFKLEGLTLLSPNLTWDIVQELDGLFQLNELALSEYSIENKQVIQGIQDEEQDPQAVLLKNSLKTQAQRILLYKFRGISSEGTMERWANATGISRGPSSFILERTDLQWSSRLLDWNLWSAFKHYALGFDKFWAHSGSI